MEEAQMNVPASPSKSSNKAVIFIIAAIVIVTIAVWGYSSTKKTTPVSVGQTNSNSTTGQLYKDGTYSAIGNYTAPSGPEEIGVSLTLSNNTITDATVEAKATIEASKNFQRRFVNNYKQFVIGKNINDVKLDKVAGASLTSKGFEVALANIMDQAKQ